LWDRTLLAWPWFALVGATATVAAALAVDLARKRTGRLDVA
jgi:hypothetical protein